MDIAKLMLRKKRVSKTNKADIINLNKMRMDDRFAKIVKHIYESYLSKRIRPLQECRDLIEKAEVLLQMKGVDEVSANMLKEIINGCEWSIKHQGLRPSPFVKG